MVGVRGFEPPTPCSRSRCATRLRYTPNRPKRLAYRRSDANLRHAGRPRYSEAQGRRQAQIGARPRLSIFRPNPPRRVAAGTVCLYVPRAIGASPSGKAVDFDSTMRRFESSRPSQQHFEFRAGGALLLRGATGLNNLQIQPPSWTGLPRKSSTDSPSLQGTSSR